MIIPYYLVNSFTNKLSSGNPSGVCLLQTKLSDDQMQTTASKINVSETAFLLRDEEEFFLRWFTPTTEIDLCGHATLGTSHILWQEKILKETQEAHFNSRSGLLKVRKKDEWIEMDFPFFESRPATAPTELLEILNIKPIHIADVFDRYLFEVSTEKEVKSVAPNFEKLRRFKKVLITSKSDDDSPFDFISRYFAPSIGVNEDPVTGTSHCCLAPYWAKKLNKTEFLGYQASTRGGVVKLKLLDDIVQLSGQAVTSFHGEVII